MKVTPSEIPDVLFIDPEVHGDERGFFIERYQYRKFADTGIVDPFVQDNHSGSRKGTLRGLHYQIENPQAKLVFVTSGKIFDVAVDLRKSSSTFGRWVGQILSAEEHQMMWIPVGFAHGFYVLSEWADLIYKVTDYYSPEWDRTLIWNDPEIGINWPIESESLLFLSPKDAQGKLLTDAEVFP
jgi:dTDP-4-dehydrorhamnose 3,5-epimerase